ncbi:hypothetical protein D3C76_1685890 [compost metagenome]
MAEGLRRDLFGNPAEAAQWQQPALDQLPGAQADQHQQQRQGPQGRAQVGLEQGMVVGTVDCQQHAHQGAVLQAHQPRGGEQVLAFLIAPRAEA